MSELEPVQKLIKAFCRLPGIGKRSAERMALKIAFDKGTMAESMMEALQEVTAHVTGCRLCGSLTRKGINPCELCVDPRRDETLLCVVEDPGDVLQIESSGGFKGRYHALHGKISPIGEEGINDIRVNPLIKRVKSEPIREVVLALNSDVESDATASYLQDVLKTLDVKVSRIAFGLPAGSGISYSDPVTLSRAMQGRREMD